MKRFLITLVCFNGLLVGCDSASKKDAGGEDQVRKEANSQSWPANMQRLAANLTEFFPLMYSQKAFNDPANEKQIVENMENLAKASHNINQNAQPSFTSSDPGMRFVAGRLEGEIHSALENFKNGQKEFARRSVQSVVRNCVYCHSQNKIGPEFNNKYFITQNLKGLLKTEKADLLIANRDFEGAMEELRSALIDTEYAQNNPFEAERALRRYLALSIRVKNDPQAGLNLLGTVLEKGIKPDYLHDLAVSWKTSLENWQREMKKTKAPAKDAMAEARKLIKQAQTVQDYPVDNAGDVYYLRATALMHDYLQRNPEGPDSVQALLLLGTSYEVLSDIGLWDVSDYYYEACIRKSPHTKISEQCYKRFEQSMYSGYSGSGGVFIPASVRKRMAELKELSKPMVK